MKNRKLALIWAIFWIHASHAGFFDGAKRGWFWFEEKPQEEERMQPRPLTPQEEQERFKEELDQARFKMIMHPSLENVRDYRQKEEKMFALAFKLAEAWEQVGFYDPSLRPEPNNVYSIKLGRKIQKEQEVKQISEFLKDYDLILFRAGGCKYCQEFEPILERFAGRYNVSVEAVSLDKSRSRYFKNKDGAMLIQALGITEYPAVIAVHKQNAAQVFELSRGLMTIDELEQYCLRAMQYLKVKNNG